MSDTDPQQVVRRLIAEVMNQRDLTVLDELYSPRLAPAARRWIEPFLESFSDIQMRIVELVAEGETVAARLACSATHSRPWLGYPPTGRRFTDVVVEQVTAGQVHVLTASRDRLHFQPQPSRAPAVDVERPRRPDRHGPWPLDQRRHERGGHVSTPPRQRYRLRRRDPLRRLPSRRQPGEHDRRSAPSGLPTPPGRLGLHGRSLLGCPAARLTCSHDMGFPSPTTAARASLSAPLRCVVGMRLGLSRCGPLSRPCEDRAGLTPAPAFLAIGRQRGKLGPRLFVQAVHPAALDVAAGVEDTGRAVELFPAGDQLRALRPVRPRDGVARLDGAVQLSEWSRSVMT
jgi:hypothetical protein